MKRRDGFEGEKLINVPDSVWQNLFKINPTFFQIYITQIGYFPKASYHYRERRKGCEDNIVIYCLSGKGHYILDSKRYEVTANQFIIIPATDVYMRYWADAHDPWTIYWIHFTGHTINGFNQFLNLDNHRGPIFTPFNTKALEIWNNMYDSLEMGFSIENVTNATFGLYNFLATFLFPQRHFKVVNDEKKDIIREVIDYMRSNLDERLTVEDFAGQVGMSASYFSSVFRKATGMPPMDYFINLKMQRACHLLDTGDIRVKEVATEVGYDDQYYFSRLFKKLMGTSPEQYRMLNRRQPGLPEDKMAD